MRNVVALLAVLALAGAASAATITVANLGAPDFSGLGDQAYPTLQRLMFTVANEAGEAQINAVSINVTTTGDAPIHQVFSEAVFLGSYTYSDSPNPGDILAMVQDQLDTFLADALFSIAAVPGDEDIAGLVEDVSGSAFAGPNGPAEALVNSINATSGYGTFFEFAGAVAGGSEADSYDIFHLVLPADLAPAAAGTGTVVVEIGIAGPGGIDATQTFEYAVPEPATMSLLAIGGIALLRRRR